MRESLLGTRRRGDVAKVSEQIKDAATVRIHRDRSSEELWEWVEKLLVRIS